MNLELQKSIGVVDINFINGSLKKNFQQGSSKVLFPKSYSELEQLVLINTSGGVTSGDKYKTIINLKNSKIFSTTQAAEKIYSGNGVSATLDYYITLDNSTLFWIPNETILFNKCNLKRNIQLNLEISSNLFFCETVVYGRSAMNETIETGYYSDQWKIFNGKKLLHFETSGFDNNISKIKNKKFTLNNECAVNTIMLFGSEMLKFEGILEEILHNSEHVTAAISQWNEKILIRSISNNNYYLKKFVDKIILIILNKKIPQMWGAA